MEETTPKGSAATLDTPDDLDAVSLDEHVTVSPVPPPEVHPTHSSSILEEPGSPSASSFLAEPANLPSTPSSPSISPPESPGPSVTATHIYGVLIVGFNHLIGPEIEYAYPETVRCPELDAALPFLALPDGAHLREEDYSYFHLFCPSLSASTIFGVSCNRQILASSLINRSKDVTRSTVQKAIVILADQPIFGPVRDRLGVVTRAFFEQRDFEDKSILRDLYNSLKDSGSSEADLYMGTSLRELVHRFRFKTLVLLKLLLLQRKVMIYASQSSVESLCNTQYSLISLLPSLLSSLQDSASPLLDNVSVARKRASTLKTSDRTSLLNFLGMPILVFGRDAFFQPYLPLQQIDMLAAESWLVGTTNSIFQQQRECLFDALVNMESATIEVGDPKLTTALTLTAEDRKWMDEIVTTVTESWNPEDPSRPLGSTFIGSDDFLRAKFEEYITSLLAAIKFVDFLDQNEKGTGVVSGTGADFDPNILQSFNTTFVQLFRRTTAFKVWDKSTDNVLFDVVEPRHPMHGLASTIEDVGIRLADGLHALRIDEGALQARDAVTKGFEVGKEGVWRAVNGVVKTGREAEIGTHVMGGVDVAKEKASAVASGIGTFFSSRLFVPKPSHSAGSSRSPSPTPDTFPASPSSASTPLARSPSTNPSDTYPPQQNDQQLPQTPSAFSSFSSFFARPSLPTSQPDNASHRDSSYSLESSTSNSTPSIGSSILSGGWWNRRGSTASIPVEERKKQSSDTLRSEDLKDVAL